MRSKQFLVIYIFLLLIVNLESCDSKKKSSLVLSNENRSCFIVLENDKLKDIGVNITDEKVMYNNKVYNLGTLNIVISGLKYSIGTATIPETNFDFYPRYITTIDTVQRYAYNLQGKGSNTVEEAQKWATFDKLIPVLVEQKQNGKVFGESLVFWFTKTDSLQLIIDRK